MSTVNRNQAVILDEVIEALANVSHDAASLDDSLLAYLIDMALLHANEIRINGSTHQKRVAKVELNARLHLCA